MTDKEFGMFAMAYKGLFPKSETFKEAFTMEVWFNQLNDLDYDTAIKALSAYAQTNKFAPAISEIREAYARITMPIQLTETEAWALVSKAIRNGTYHSQEEFDKLPESVQKAVGSPDNIRNWASIDAESVEAVIGSNFIKTYRAVIEKEVKRLQTSPDLRITTNNQNLRLE